MESYIAAIEATDKLKPLSKRQYINKLQLFVRKTGRSINWIIHNPGYAVEQLEELGLGIRSRQAYIDAVMAVFRYADLPKELIKQYEEWYIEFKTLKDEINAMYDENKPNARQREAYVPWDSVLDMRDALPLNSDERLLLCMYSMIPPARADYGHVYVVHGDDPPPRDEHANYVMITPRKVTLVLREYKTASTYGPLSRNLPPDLAAVIRASLAARRRPYLFTMPSQPDSPFRDNQAFADWVSVVWNRLFEKPFTINSARHSYISSLDFNALSVRQVNEIAKAMMHSSATLRRYRLFYDDEASEPDESE